MAEPNTNEFKIPGATDRVSVIGRTGSGKTTFAAWLLSHMHKKTRPSIIVDFKGDEFLGSIPGLKELDVTARAPNKPGLYVVRPMPEDDEIDDFLWRIWERGKTLVYVDEAHMLHGSRAFPALLSQGRSKGVPMIVLTQRPSWVSRFVFSEADFYSVFHLNDIRDQQIVQRFVPKNLSVPLPEFHSHWHNVKRYSTIQLQPVPEQDSIRNRLAEKTGAVTIWTEPTYHGRSKTGSLWF